MNSYILRTALSVLLFQATLQQATASDFGSIKKISEVEYLAKSIPIDLKGIDARNVDERLKSQNLRITGGTKYSIDSKNEITLPEDRVGDLHFTILTTEPSDGFKRTVCNMWGSADFLKRSGKYYPESRTANWLLTGNCTTNFKKPG